MKIEIEFEMEEDALKPALEALIRNAGKLTQAEAASLTHLSRSGFSTKFRRLHRLSFRAARVAVKLEVARRLLTSTSSSVADIATVLGYAERGKFDKIFKQYYGLSPAKYRQNPTCMAQSGPSFLRLGS